MNTVLSLFKYETYKMLHSKLTVIIISLMVILAIAMGLPLGSSPQSKEIHEAMMTMGRANSNGASPRTVAMAKAPKPTCDKPSPIMELRRRNSGVSPPRRDVQRRKL